MQLTRRTLLAGSTAALTSLAGCQLPLLSNAEQVDLELFNYTPTPQPIKISLLRPEKDEFSEAEAFSREFEVPPPDDGESAGTLDIRDVADRRQYLVRAVPKFGIRPPYQYRYFPGENTTASDNPYIDVRIYPNCYFRDCDNTEGVYVRFL